MKSHAVVMGMLISLVAVVARGQDSTRGRAWLVGHAHIDLSWLWPRSETIHEICPLTFRSVLNLMDQYPDFVFAQSSAQVYKWMERYYPKDFQRIAEKIQSGQWEVVGGAWDEHNANIPSGESLVRQHLYAKRYFMERFGIDVRVGWLPDVFGFNWNLPQIYRKVGIEYFLTHKLKWQIERNNPPIPFPYHVFWWEAPDGSRVLAYHTVGGYGERITAKDILEDLDTLRQKHGIEDLLVVYGRGDHGGGPLPDMLERAHELASRKNFPKIIFAKAVQYFDHLKGLAREHSFPVVKDELYVKTHRGTLTTDSQVKRDNRRCEELLTNVESLSVVAWALGGRYPAQELKALWEKLLFGQVHDNLDGSSIRYVYLDAATDYADIKQEGGALLDRALKTICDRLDTRGPTEQALVVFNTLSWPRTEVVRLDLSSLGAATAKVLEADGSELPAQVVEDEDGRFLVFVAREVPAMGCRIYFLKPGAPPSAGPGSLRVKGMVLENEHLRVELDKATGYLKSVFDKRLQRNVLAPKALGNVLELYEDQPPNAPAGEPAWNIYLGACTVLDKPESVTVVERGPVRARVRVVHRFGSSRFWQDVILYAGFDRVDFEFRGDWHERYRFLKVAFPVAAQNDYATYEIPYAVIQRFTHIIKEPVPTQMELPPRAWEPADQLKHEVAALRWVDLTDRSGQFGVAVLNDCKYGHSVAGDTIRLSLLRGPRRGYPRTPESWADQSEDPIVGIHHVRYALVPHAGDWRRGDAVRRGLSFNYGFVLKLVDAHAGDLTQGFSAVEAEPENVVIGAIKRAEDGDHVILRLVETAGRPTTAVLRFAEAPSRITETDLMEWDKYVVPQSFPVQGKEVAVPMQPFEIKTLRLFY
ncbi:MAG: glycosyl hydrolase-related protein [candidate division KSB1 bacterium]|nr:glycosyl hydrolase-related protein [candidate division KSB1 bacterium]